MEKPTHMPGLPLTLRATTASAPSRDASSAVTFWLKRSVA